MQSLPASLRRRFGSAGSVERESQFHCNNIHDCAPALVPGCLARHGGARFAETPGGTIEPTKGAITKIYAGFTKNVFVPLLEVRCVRRLQNDQGSRYAISAKDGDCVDQALAISGSSLVRQIETGQVALNTLIRLTVF